MGSVEARRSRHGAPRYGAGRSTTLSVCVFGLPGHARPRYRTGGTVQRRAWRSDQVPLAGWMYVWPSMVVVIVPMARKMLLNRMSFCSVKPSGLVTFVPL